MMSTENIKQIRFMKKNILPDIIFIKLSIFKVFFNVNLIVCFNKIGFRNNMVVWKKMLTWLFSNQSTPEDFYETLNFHYFSNLSSLCFSSYSLYFYNTSKVKSKYNIKKKKKTQISSSPTHLYFYL